MLLEPLFIRVSAAVAGVALTVGGSGAGPPSALPAAVSPGATTATGPAQPSPWGVWRWPLPGAPAVVHPFAAPPGPYAAGHRGVDLSADPGTAVLAPAPGVVTVAGSVAGVPVVVVSHEGGLRSTFQPVTGTVPVGTRVPTGARVGTLAADPGHCAPAGCLHWGVLRASTYLDPLRLLHPPRVVLLPEAG